MKSYQREHVGILLERLKKPPICLILVSGPRQTGKTTLVRQAMSRLDREYLYLSADNLGPEAPPFAAGEVENLAEASGHDWLIRAWRRARLKADRSARGFVLVLDEIQGIPRWSSTVKGLWDEDRMNDCLLHVVILGSSPLLMQQGLTEGLTGRFVPLHVGHWSFREMRDAFGFDLARYAYFGGYPGSVPHLDSHERWREYIRAAVIEPHLEKDIFMVTRVDKPALFRQLFELGCDCSGQIFSYNKLRGRLDGAGSTDTIAHYLGLMSRSGLLASLRNYSSSRYRVKVSNPKLNVLDTSFMAARSSSTFEQAREDGEFWGRLMESAVGAHLCNSGRYIDVCYWRDRDDEVDFVLQQGAKTVAIEVKSGRRGRPAPGLEEFKRRFRPRWTLVVGSGGMPLEEFLLHPAAHWFEGA